MRILVLLAVTVAAPAALANPAPQQGSPKGGWPHQGGRGKRPEWWHSSWKGGLHGYNETGEPRWMAKQRADAVKEAFQFAWDGYSQYV